MRRAGPWKHFTCGLASQQPTFLGQRIWWRQALRQTANDGRAFSHCCPTSFHVSEYQCAQAYDSFDNVWQNGDVHSLRSNEDAESSRSQYLPLLNRINYVSDEPHAPSTGKGHFWITSRADAYIQLRQHAPLMVAQITDAGLNALCHDIVKEGMTNVVKLLYRDFGGRSKDVHNSDLMDDELVGLLNAPKGSERRLEAVQTLLNSAIADRRYVHSRVWDEKSVRILDPQISLEGIALFCELLQEDITTVAEQRQHAPEDLLRRLAPETARWLLGNLDRLESEGLLRLVVALWRFMHFEETFRRSFPNLDEASAMIRYFLRERQLDDQDNYDASDVGACMLVAPKYALEVFQELDKAHPEVVGNSQSVANTVAEAFESWVIANHIDTSKMGAIQDNIWLTSAMAFVSVFNAKYDMTQGYLEKLEKTLNGLAKMHDLQSFQMVFMPLIRTIFRILMTTNEDSVGLVQSYLLPALARASVVSESDASPMISPSEAPANLALLREYMELLHQGNLQRQLLDTVFALSDAFDAIGIQQRDSITSLLHGDLALGLVQFMSAERDVASLHRFFRCLKFVGKSGKLLLEDADRLDRFFSPSHRAGVVLACAKSRIPSIAIPLYIRWTGVSLSEPPLNLSRASSLIEELIETKDKMIGFMTTRNKLASTDPRAQLSQSSECMLAMIVMLVRGADRSWLAKSKKGVKSRQKEDQEALSTKIDLAFRIFFVFLSTKAPHSWDANDTSNVISALYRFGFPQRASTMTNKLIHQKGKELYTSGAAAHLHEAMAFVNPEAAVEMAEKPRKGSGMLRLYKADVLSPLATQCLLVGRNDLAARLMHVARKQGVLNDFSIRSIAAILSATTRLGLGLMRQIANVPDDAAQSKNDPKTEALDIWVWILRLIERDLWKPEPNLLNWMVVNAAHRSDDLHHEGDRKASAAYSTLAARMFCLGVDRLDQAHHIAAMAVLKTFRFTMLAQEKRGRAGQDARSRINELDKVVHALRWASFYDADDFGPSMMNLPEFVSRSDDQEATQRHPARDHLGVSVFRALILSYCRQGDLLGAASVVEWARDECKLTLDDLGEGFGPHRNNGKDFACQIKELFDAEMDKRGYGEEERVQVYRYLGGQQSVPRTKIWWSKKEGLSEEGSLLQATDLVNTSSTLL